MHIITVWTVAYLCNTTPVYMNAWLISANAVITKYLDNIRVCALPGCNRTSRHVFSEIETCLDMFRFRKLFGGAEALSRI